MDIKELNYFITIADAGSFSAAAEKLFVSQQGLSGAIKRLENELGYPLFHRTMTGVTLNERGREFYESALPIVSAFRDLVRAFCGTGRPTISITCAYGIISKCPVPLQRLLLNRNASFSMESSEQYSAECEAMVENGQCNFGIVYAPVDSTRFVSHPLFTRRQCLIMHKNHRFATQESISIAQLRDEPLIFPHARSRTNAVLRRYCREAGFEPRVVFESDNPMEIMNLVRANPELIGRMFQEDALDICDPSIALSRFQDIDVSIQVCLIEKKRRTLTPIEREIRRTILDSVKKP